MLETCRFRAENGIQEALDAFVVAIGAVIVEAILERAARLTRDYADDWGAEPAADLCVHNARVAIAILYHWWLAEKGSHGKVHLEPLKRLDGVINGLRAGLRYNPETGRSTAFAHGCDDFYPDGQPPDILREVAFAEAVCQEVEHAKRTDVVDKPNTLRTRFNEQYDHTVRVLKQRQSDDLVLDVFSWFPTQLWLPREGGSCPLEVYKGKEPLALWLVTVAQNLVRDKRKKERRIRPGLDEKTCTYNQHLEPDDDPPPDGIDPVQLYLDRYREYLETLVGAYRNVIDGLPPQKALMWLRYGVKGHPQKAIAVEARVSVATVSRTCSKVDRHARDQAAKSDRTWLSWHQSYLAEPKPVKEAIEAILRDMLVVEFVLPKVSGGAPVNRRGW